MAASLAQASRSAAWYKLVVSTPPQYLEEQEVQLMPKLELLLLLFGCRGALLDPPAEPTPVATVKQRLPLITRCPAASTHMLIGG